MKIFSVEREERAKALGLYMVSKKATVRETAKAIGIPKSTAFEELTVVLPAVDIRLAKRVRKVLDKNKSERHLRGGLATKLGYATGRIVSAKKKR